MITKFWQLSQLCSQEENHTALGQTDINTEWITKITFIMSRCYIVRLYKALLNLWKALKKHLIQSNHSKPNSFEFLFHVIFKLFKIIVFCISEGDKSNIIRNVSQCFCHFSRMKSLVCSPPVFWHLAKASTKPLSLRAAVISIMCATHMLVKYYSHWHYPTASNVCSCGDLVWSPTPVQLQETGSWFLLFSPHLKWTSAVAICHVLRPGS